MAEISPMKQLKISLPDDLRTRLDWVAQLSGKSVAEEIRSRVEETFQRRDTGPEMEALVEAVRWLARHIQIDMGAEWHQHGQVRRALLDGISEYMLEHQKSDVVEISADAKEGAHAVGRAFARAYLRIEEDRKEREGDS
jgi:hypothetical protein